MVPEKFKRRPFVVWGFALLTIVVLAVVFGPENVWKLIEAWASPAS